LEFAAGCCIRWLRSGAVRFTYSKPSHVPLFLLFVLFALVSFPFSSFAEDPIPEILTPIDASDFDHSVTGFVLDGQHSMLDCENCHVGGVFEELPRECSQCHDNVFATGTSSTHIPVVEPCDTCHTTLGFEGSAMTTLMDHSVLSGQLCSSCHDNVTAIGKSPTHVPTVLDCGECHNINNWVVSAFDHSTVVGQPCVSCHNGVKETGKNAQHIATTDACEACHLTSSWVPTITVDHSQVMGVCSSCHDNIIATGKPANHIPTTSECNACHSTLQWVPAAVDHSSFVGNCITSWVTVLPVTMA